MEGEPIMARLLAFLRGLLSPTHPISTTEHDEDVNHLPYALTQGRGKRRWKSQGWTSHDRRYAVVLQA